MNKAVREMNSQITSLALEVPPAVFDQSVERWEAVKRYIRELEGYKRLKEGKQSWPTHVSGGVEI
jgi:hypothetical protein